MKTMQLRIAVLLALGIIAACAAETPSIEAPLPSQLALSTLPQTARTRLRAVLTVPGVLSASELEIDHDAGVARGSFTLPNNDVLDAKALLEFFTGLTFESDEVLVGRASGSLIIKGGEDNALNLGALRTGGEPIYDLNRNGRTNLEDLVAGVEPAPGPMPVDLSPRTISFESGVEIGGFTRSFFVMENTSEESVAVDLDVRLAPGVSLVPLSRLFENGGATASAHEQATLGPGEEQVFAVTFAPANPSFLVGSLSVRSMMSVSGVGHGTLMRLLGNPEGAIPQPPADYDIPMPPEGQAIGGYTGSLVAYPKDRLFSRAPKSTAIAEVDAGAIGSVDVDFAYMVSVLPRHRFSTTLDGLAQDIDLYLFQLDDQFVPNETPVASSTNAGLSAESADFDATSIRETTTLILVALDRITTEESSGTSGGLSETESVTAQTAMYSVPELLRPCTEETTESCGPIDSQLQCPDSYGEALACGDAKGNTQFTLQGKNFQSGLRVTVGGQSAICATVDVGEVFDLVRCLSPPAVRDPAHEPNVTVVLMNPDGQAATLAEGFTYLPPPPKILAISPSQGPNTGGSTITVRGMGFFDREGVNPNVRVGIHEADMVELVDDSQLRATLPACASCNDGDKVDVVVTNPDGQSGTLFEGFTYIEPDGPPPVVTSVTPQEGETTGGTHVTLTGSNFEDGALVRFAGVSASAIKWVSATTLTCQTPPGEPGPAAVEVVNMDHQTGRLLAGDGQGFTYVVPKPKISGLIPTTGAQAGGDFVIITGTGFQSGAEVLFGNVLATSATVNSTSTITCITPPGSGIVDVSVVNTLDANSAVATNGFTYEAPSGPPPTVTAVSPTDGSTLGGEVVQVTGTGLQPERLQVLFGAVPSPSVLWISETSANAQTPPHPAATISITVRNKDGQTGKLDSGFTFRVPPPKVTSIFPVAGPTEGGTVVRLSGSGFQPNAYVLFADQPAAEFVVDNAGQITCTTPAHSAGAVDVSVLNPDGKSAVLASAFAFTAPEALSLQGVLPSGGPTTGGTIVFVSGTGFAANATVRFGTVTAPQTIVSSTTAITTTTPVHAAGTVSLTVVQGGEQQTLQSAFAFVEPASPPPAISAIVPNNGPDTGLTRVELRGSNFDDGARVFFGDAEAQIITAQSNSALLLALSPPGATGSAANVRVQNPDGQSDVVIRAFEYTSLPRSFSLAAAVPDVADPHRDTSVFLIGTAFQVGATVHVSDGTWTSSERAGLVVDEHLLQVHIPPYGGAKMQVEVAVDVTVTNADQSAKTLQAGIIYQGVIGCDPMDPATCPLGSCECSGGPETCFCLGGEPGPVCESAFDCEGGPCVDGVCRAEHCVDGTQNADETGVDCGGTDCQPCAAGCKNGILDAGEQCDDGNDNDADRCANDCTLNPSCDLDSAREEGEACDGPDLGGLTCIHLGYLGGVLQCDNVCQLNVSGCVEPRSTCGNEALDAGEQCDGSNMGAVSGCTDFGFTRGTLACSETCRYDLSACEAALPPHCGNGIWEPGEECDGGQIEPGHSCASDFGFAGGTFSCHPATCRVLLHTCTPSACGDGRLDPWEECDTVDNVSGLTCADLGRRGSRPGCSNCQWDLAACGLAPALTCFNGQLDADETDVDCGGPDCLPCADGMVCAIDGNCLSGVCVGDVCQAPSCSDSVINGDETGYGGTECGGAVCPPCPVEAGCVQHADCSSNNCVSGSCATAFGFGQCYNGFLDSGETDVDCGGPCYQCSASMDCLGNLDCGPGVLCDGANVCIAIFADACYNNSQDGVESDVDCGGVCRPCSDGDTCNTSGDCGSGTCSGNTCASAMCGNSVTEPGEDCDDGNLDNDDSCRDDCTFAACDDGVRRTDIIDPLDPDYEECDDGDGDDTNGCNNSCRVNLCSGGTSNNTRDPGEPCDGTDINGMSCWLLGFLGGTLACDSTCRWDEAFCWPPDLLCGDGYLDLPFEECDGGSLGGETCTSLPLFGFTGGALGCRQNCLFDVSRCTPTAWCGNNAAEGPENCDGSDTGIAANCVDLSFASGTLSCLPDCSYDLANCEGAATTPTCANGRLEPWEECDNANNIRGLDCRYFGSRAGSLSCDAGCRINTTGCSNPPIAGCFNGFVDGNEVDIDCGGPDCLPCLDGQTCSLGSDCISNACNTTCDQGGCADGVINGDEADFDGMGGECGGSSCLPCPGTQACTVDWDCASFKCINGACEAPPTGCDCFDNAPTAGETGIDCGGPSCIPCAETVACVADTDCGTGLVCASGFCSGPLTDECFNNIPDPGEVGLDCGGFCKPCPHGTSCTADFDCASGLCDIGGTNTCDASGPLCVVGFDGVAIILEPDVTEGSPLSLEVTDSDAIANANGGPGNDSVNVLVTCDITGDSETVMLSESGITEGLFQSSISTAPGAGPVPDGILQVQAGATATLTYVDLLRANGDTGGVDVTDTATISANP